MESLDILEEYEIFIVLKWIKLLIFKIFFFVFYGFEVICKVMSLRFLFD